MSTSAATILEQALELDEPDRAELVARLLDSLEEPLDPEAQTAWTATLERRGAELESGAVAGVPWEEVRRKLSDRAGGS